MHIQLVMTMCYCFLHSGPSKAEISGADGKVATVKQLQEGHYVFKLTVTDSKGLTGTDTVAVSVKKGKNKPNKIPYIKPMKYL